MRRVILSFLVFLGPPHIIKSIVFKKALSKQCTVWICSLFQTFLFSE